MTQGRAYRALSPVGDTFEALAAAAANFGAGAAGALTQASSELARMATDVLSALDNADSAHDSARATGGVRGACACSPILRGAV